MERYRYSPLAGDRLRLLCLLPGRFRDEIKVLISHEAFSEEAQPKYEALSYVWGSEENPATICVCDKSDDSPFSTRKTWTSMPITRNLEVALRHLRYSVRRRVLWVDAICINQRDDEEKGRQLPRMGDIYQRARSVAIWLGIEADNSALAIHRLEMIAKDVQISEPYHSVDLRYKRTLFGNESRKIERDSQAQLDRIHDWAAINHLLHREWFTRLWVYQEAHLAADATVFVGCESIPWRRFFRAFNWIYFRITLNSKSTLRNILDPTFFWRVLLILTPPTDSLLHDLLIRTKHLKCSDPRDRFHGLLGLLSRFNIPFVMPGRSLSTQETYRAWTMAAVSWRKNLNILELCNYQESEQNSWSLNPSLVDLPNPIGHQGIAQAGGDVDYYSSLAVDPESNNNFLLVKGMFIDDIDDVYPACPTDVSRDDVVNVVRSWSTESIHTYKYKADYKEVFASTLVCNIFEHLPTMMPEEWLDPAFCAASLQGIWNGEENDGTDLYKRVLHEITPGRSLFHTKAGYLGLCSPSVKAGDRVFVAESKRTPIIVREIAHSPENYHLTGGDCYVHGMMHMEAFLGPLPTNWSIQHRILGGQSIVVYVQNGRHPQQEDPRLRTKPPRNWEIAYLDEDGELYPSEYDDQGKRREMIFHDLNANVETYQDPRHLSDALTRDHGVKFEEIRLV